MRISVTGLAPVNAEAALLLFGVTNGLAVSQWVTVLGSMLCEGTDNGPWFDGSRAGNANFAHAWEQTANASPSTRVALQPRPPEALRWTVGTDAYSFLENLAGSVGMRLLCDEQRRWWLINPDDWTAPGRLTLSPRNTTDGTDSISRDDDETWCTAVAIKYTWRDSTGTDRVQWDVAGVGGKVRIIERSMPFPGAGLAAAVLQRMSGRGRTQDVTVAADWNATTGQEASISLPSAPEQVGWTTGIQWDADGLMRVQTRALTDALPGTYLAWPDTTYAATADAVTYASL